MEKSVASTTNSTTVDFDSSPSIPTAAILCLAIGAYVILTVIALLIRRYVKSQVAWERSTCCQTAICDCGGCRTCWNAFEDKLAACKTCEINLCTDQCHCSKVDCQCCRCPSLPSLRCCLGSPLFECGRCNCTCGFQLPECHSINCFCFEITIS